MIKQLPVWKFLLGNVQAQVPVMMLYVLESKGSSPGRQGFLMAVNANGKMEGSIGGGMMEYKFVEMAREQLRVNSHERRAAQIKKQIHDKSAAKNQSGMICSGEQTVLFYQVKEADELHIKNIINCVEDNKNGRLMLSPQGIDFSDASPAQDFYFEKKSDEDWSYMEKLGYKNHLFIIGGGHCALAFSKLMSTMDYYIHLFDDRSELNTMIQNEFVHEKKQVNSYEEISNLISAGEHNYVVIMTFGYRSDTLALKSLLHKDFKYLGLLGSKKKIETMFNDLKDEGFDESALKKVHAPIGLDIHSQTPEEIAVSIAAEIIRVKNG